jgi:hypothetical protein
MTWLAQEHHKDNVFKQCDIKKKNHICAANKFVE